MTVKTNITQIDTSNNPKDPIYTLDYETSLEQYKACKSASRVLRRYSDFHWLHRELKRQFPGRIIPPLPPLRAYNGYGSSSPEYIDEEKRVEMARFLENIAQHEQLMTSNALQAFLESGNQFVPVTSGKSNSVTNFFTKMAKTVKSASEVEPWYEHQKQDLGTHFGILERTQKSVEKLERAQKELANSYSELAMQLSDLGGMEYSQSLANTYRRLATSFEKAGNSYITLTDIEIFRISEFLQYHLKYAKAAEKTFDNRLGALTDYEAACKNTLKKKYTVDKLRTSGQVRHDKVDSALSDFNDAKTNEEQTKVLFDKMSKYIREEEWQTFINARARETVDAIKAFSADAISVAEKQQEEWSILVPDLKSIALDEDKVIDVKATEKIKAEVL